MAGVEIELLISSILYGLIWGGMYAVMSLGLALIWSTSKVTNFSHGSIYVWAGYIWLFAFSATKQNYLIASVAAVVFALVLGFGLEKGLISPLKKKPGWDLNCIIALLGFSLIVDSLALFSWGSYFKRIPEAVAGSIFFGVGYSISYQSILTFIIGISTLVLLSLFMKKTKLGLSMRAIANDPEGASIVGIDTSRVSFYAFGIGTALAGLAAIFLGNIILIGPNAGGSVLLKAFIIIVIGGLGSFKGTIASAFLVALAEAILAVFLGLANAVPLLFLLMIIILVVKPSGLFEG